MKSNKSISRKNFVFRFKQRIQPELIRLAEEELRKQKEEEDAMLAEGQYQPKLSA